MTTKRKKCGKDSLMSCFVLLSFIYLFDGFKPKCQRPFIWSKVRTCVHMRAIVYIIDFGKFSIIRILKK